MKLLRCRLAVVFSSEDLRGDVVWCAAEGAGGVAGPDPLLRAGAEGRERERAREQEEGLTRNPERSSGSENKRGSVEPRLH